jgi:hypothetical protein
VNLIASAAKDRAVHVYRMSEAPDAESITITPIVTFRESDVVEGSNIMTVNWHPFLQVSPLRPAPARRCFANDCPVTTLPPRLHPSLLSFTALNI